jgi:hypothetical protein
VSGQGLCTKRFGQEQNGLIIRELPGDIFYLGPKEICGSSANNQVSAKRHQKEAAYLSSSPALAEAVCYFSATDVVGEKRSFAAP